MHWDIFSVHLFNIGRREILNVIAMSTFFSRQGNSFMSCQQTLRIIYRCFLVFRTIAPLLNNVQITLRYLNIILFYTI